MDSNPEDLLSFKEFAPVHGGIAQRQATAEINVNSPQRIPGNTDGGGVGTAAPSGNYDPLQALINDMSNSVKILGGNDLDGQKMQTQSSGFTDSPTEEGDGKPASSYNFWSIEYYQKFFDVDTLTVIERIFSSMIPKRAPPNYLKTHIGLNPDLYGPFWIIITLIFSIAISGNIASYLQNANSDFHWKYKFHLVSYAATAIFIYACFVPLALWGILKWSLKPVDDDIETESSGYIPTLLTLLCVYGYSLSIYIPVSILWVIQISILQWILVITAGLLSGAVLIFVLTPALRNSRYSLFLIIGIIGAHFLLAAGFMLYFFHDPGSEPNITPALVEQEAIKIIGTTVKTVVKEVQQKT